MLTIITRRSRIGFGWNTTPTGEGTRICATTYPDIIGTPKIVMAKKNKDPVYRSIRNGTYHTTAWFVRVGGEWKKIKPAYYGDSIEDRFDELYYDDPGYRRNRIEIEIEQ